MVLHFAGTISNVRESRSAVATSEAERESKTNDDDDKGEFIVYMPFKNVDLVMNIPDVRNFLPSKCLCAHFNGTRGQSGTVIVKQTDTK